MIITITPSSDHHNFYSATSSNGVVLVSRSPSPLLDSARALLAQSTALSTHELLMYRAGSSTWDLRATSVAYAASLEAPGTRFVPFRPAGRRAIARTLTESSEG